MKFKIKSILVGLALIFGLSLQMALPAIANAASFSGPTMGTFATVPTSALCGGATGTGLQGVSATGSGGSSCPASSGTTLDNTIKLVLNILSVIVGIIAVITLIIGGIKYITSGGSSDKTTSAKDTILFAIVWLVIVALAQIVVTFVLTKVGTLQ